MTLECKMLQEEMTLECQMLQEEKTLECAEITCKYRMIKKPPLSNSILIHINVTLFIMGTYEI